MSTAVVQLIAAILLFAIGTTVLWNFVSFPVLLGITALVAAEHLYVRAEMHVFEDSGAE